MRLEGTLDAFSLPDIFQLLSYTKKSGALHLRREDKHGSVHVVGGQIVGAVSDVDRQELLRRLLGSGLLSPETLCAAAATAAGSGDSVLGTVLALGALDADRIVDVAREQILDAVFDLLRWPDGDFAFVIDEPRPAGPELALAVTDTVEEGRRRLDAWTEVARLLPTPALVLTVARHPGSDPTLTAAEWALLALVDGRRSVGEVVERTGAGEFAVATALAGLVGRGLLVPVQDGGDELGGALALLADLEGRTPEPVPETTAAVREPAAARETAPVSEDVVAPRPEPMLPWRSVDFGGDTPRVPAPTPATVSMSSMTPTHGSCAVAPDLDCAPHQLDGVIERDPSVNKSLLLRLIAGVRGL